MDVVAGVTIRRCNKADATVLMLDEASDPISSSLDGGKSRGRVLGPKFQRSKRDSKTGLSLDPRGRLNDATTLSVASIVEPFIGPPLSECKTQPARVLSGCSRRMRSIT